MLKRLTLLNCWLTFLELDAVNYFVERVIITIYCYFTGKLREIYFTKGSQDQFGLIKHPERSEGCFTGQIGRGIPR